MSESSNLTHLDEQGQARMVDVGHKAETAREAVARAEVHMSPATLSLLAAGQMPKGDVLAVARVAGILAAKRTGELIPLCHPLPLTRVEVHFRLDPERSLVEVEARVATVARTGVEMEALTAAAVAALTLYDMAKAVEKGITIQNLRLVRKTGGKSGTWERPGEALEPVAGAGEGPAQPAGDSAPGAAPPAGAPAAPPAAPDR